MNFYNDKLKEIEKGINEENWILIEESLNFINQSLSKSSDLNECPSEELVEAGCIRKIKIWLTKQSLIERRSIYQLLIYVLANLLTAPFVRLKNEDPEMEILVLIVDKIIKSKIGFEVQVLTFALSNICFDLSEIDFKKLVMSGIITMLSEKCQSHLTTIDELSSIVFFYRNMMGCPQIYVFKEVRLLD